MKTLLILGAAAITAITLNVNASDTLLSPRAIGNQINHTTGINSDANLVSVDHYAVTVAPRATGNQIAKTTETSSDVNPATQCSRNMVASPKAIQACAASPSAAMPCCAVAAR